ncbi:MAG TPA: aspartate carbamoyltransferase catalytic subunit, partial [Kofleriaceae bacterium]|nr:aspartate carbamoyltransferase catalytic subunit [Kofleriaceae bacterium]
MPRHLVSIADLDRDEIVRILDHGDRYWALAHEPVKKLVSLRGRTVINMFFENSTRTRTSFEIAAKRLSAEAINISAASTSTTKGETLLDTADNLEAMYPDAIVVRHSFGGAAAMLAREVSCAVINAGDGQHEHPTQALLDALSMRRAFGYIAGLKVAICGDVLHSRVARSNVGLLTMLGAEVRVVGPPTLMPTDVARWGVAVHHDLRQGIDGCDIVMMLRL